jgi:5'-nucleotidase
MKRFFAAALAILLAGCGVERRVVIVSTNDIHSSIDNFPRLATFVEGVRATEGADRVLLVDAGDRWTGNPFVDLAAEQLAPIVELQNELGYNVSTLGNHAFDWGQPLLRERLDQMRFPVVCANIESAGSELGPIAPYVFIEAGGLRFAFLGLVTNFSSQGRPEGKAEHFTGLTFPDVFETAARYAPLTDSCDLYVGLTHIGHTSDLALAERVPGMGLIIGGDSHTEVTEPVRVGGTLVTQAGSKLKYAGVTTVVRQGRGRRARTTIENRLVLLDTIAPSPRFAGMVRRYNDNPALLGSIGSTAAPFSKLGVKNLAAAAIRSATGADLAIYHSGGVRVDSLGGGVSIADLHSIDPFRSEVYTMRLTPGQIKGLVMNKFNDPSPKESHAPDLVPDGFAYTIVTDEAGEAVNVIFDRPERASYLVAMPDYVYKNYKFDRPADAVNTGMLVTAALGDYIAAHSPLSPDNTQRITIR